MQFMKLLSRQANLYLLKLLANTFGPVDITDCHAKTATIISFSRKLRHLG